MPPSALRSAVTLPRSPPAPHASSHRRGGARGAAGCALTAARPIAVTGRAPGRGQRSSEAARSQSERGCSRRARERRAQGRPCALPSAGRSRFVCGCWAGEQVGRECATGPHICWFAGRKGLDLSRSGSALKAVQLDDRKLFQSGQACTQPVTLALPSPGCPGSVLPPRVPCADEGWEYFVSPRPSRVREWLSGPAFFAGRLGTQTALTKRYGVPPTSDPKIEASQARTNRCRKLGASQRENILFYLYSYQTNGHTPSVLGGIAGGRACPGICVCVSRHCPAKGCQQRT